MLQKAVGDFSITQYALPFPPKKPVISISWLLQHHCGSWTEHIP